MPRTGIQTRSPGRLDALARELFEAARARRLVDPLTDALPDLRVEEGYAIQDALLALHEADGARVTGAKLGLTSRAKQVEMGIADPIRGWLTDRMRMVPGEALELASLGQARAEPEIALMLARDLRGPEVTEDDVLAATGTLHAALEILDSRYTGYRFRLPDVVADNASGGRYVLGHGVDVREVPDLGLVGCLFEQDGMLLATAAGVATMGHPATATAWLVRELDRSGRGLREGDVVLTGGLTAVAHLAPGTTVRATFDRLGSVELTCA